MMSKPMGTLPARPPSKAMQALHPQQDTDEHLGPAMQALSAKEQAFVMHLLMGESFANAARLAGYGTPTSSAASFASLGYRVSHFPRVLDALAEESRKAIRSLVPSAIKAVKEIVETKGDKDRLKAANAIMERIDPTVQRVQVDGKIEIVDHRQEALTQLRTLKDLGVSHAKLEELFGYSGLPLLEQQLAAEDSNNIVDADFVEVKDDPDKDLGL
jgi:phage terminase small subunit